MDRLIKLLPERLVHELSFFHVQPDFGMTPFDHRKLTTMKSHQFIAYSLFNANLCAAESDIDHIYLMGILQNVMLSQVVYPGWTVLVYVDFSSYTQYTKLYQKYLHEVLKHDNALVLMVDFRTQLPKEHHDLVMDKFGDVGHNERGWDLALVCASTGKDEKITLQFGKTCWRFFPAGEQVVFMSRDADARLNAREALAVDEWMRSNVPFHRIFDTMAHANPMLAGSWGAKPECHSILSDALKFGQCKKGTEALPDIISTVGSFLGDRDRLFAGYGIDEAFLQIVEKLMASDLYENVMTFGAGGFYSGGVVFSMLKGKSQGVKLGKSMMTLLPYSTPDNWHGDHQKETSFQYDQENNMVLSRMSYFFNEDLPIRAKVEPGVIDWIIHSTLHFRKCSAEDFTQSRLTETFHKFKITKLTPKAFLNAITKLTPSQCQTKLGFDPRVLPQFWYCLTKGVNGYLPFFETYGTFVSNEYEIRVFQSAMREAFLEHAGIQKGLLALKGVEEFLKIHERIVNILVSGKTKKLVFNATNLAPFFVTVAAAVRKSSRVVEFLNKDELTAYFEEMTYCVPIASLNRFNLEF